MTEEFRRIWSFIEKAEPAQEMLSVLVPGEGILQCHKTNRDMSALINERIITLDRQGLAEKKIEIYSIPYRSIGMWSTENARKLFDIDVELELWAKAGHFEINVDKECNIREFDTILGNAILDQFLLISHVDMKVYQSFDIVYMTISFLSCCVSMLKKIGQVKVLSYVTGGRPSAGISQRQGCTDNGFPHPADSEHGRVFPQTSESIRFHVLLKNAGG